MNIYSTEFFATCPLNGMRVKYQLRIETEAVIKVEDILSALPTYGYHEAIADRFASFGGKQTLIADHHSVTIETTR